MANPWDIFLTSSLPEGLFQSEPQGRYQNYPGMAFGYPMDTMRPVVKNQDGSVSTELTATFQVNINGKDVFVNIPTVVGGKVYDPETAYRLWEQGQNTESGYFNTQDEASTAAQNLHAQWMRYLGMGGR